MTRTIGDRVRSRRAAVGWTQEQLAEASGVRPATISRIERGHLAPSLAVLYELAQALGTAVGDLVGGAPVEDPDQRKLLDVWLSVDPAGRRALLELLEALDRRR
ncbi:MAG: helix-turn-helix transcriptional regulator [Myxococcales bacterium]|nr:helix-turn-helix transcriptional regulator [Myxococcales bacterium]